MKAGDFVNLISEFDDVWHEIKSVWPNSDFIQVYDDRYYDGTDMILKSNVHKVHLAGDTWAKGEVRIVCTSQGGYGRTKYGKIRPIIDFLELGSSISQTDGWGECPYPSYVTVTIADLTTSGNCTSEAKRIFRELGEAHAIPAQQLWKYCAEHEVVSLKSFIDSACFYAQVRIKKEDGVVV